VAGGKVYVGTVDGRLVALDAKTGATLWDVAVADYRGDTEAVTQLKQDSLSRLPTIGTTGVGLAAAPMVHDGRVFVGIMGVGLGSPHQPPGESRWLSLGLRASA
jgi:glucose dehydrogenase